VSYSDLIAELKDAAIVEGPGTLANLLREAANAIKKLVEEKRNAGKR